MESSIASPFIPVHGQCFPQEMKLKGRLSTHNSVLAITKIVAVSQCLSGSDPMAPGRPGKPGRVVLMSTSDQWPYLKYCVQSERETPV